MPRRRRPSSPTPVIVVLGSNPRRGRLHTLITQNVDGRLGRKAAGSEASLVVEVHGTVREVLCLDCGDRASIEVAIERCGPVRWDSAGAVAAS